MRPQTKAKELPKRDAVKTKIKNCFIDFLEDIRAAISLAPGEISALWDLWTAPYTKDPYLGLMIQWIEVKGAVWVMRAEVVAFHKIFGAHTGINLARYFLLLTDRIGVTSKNHSKVSSSIP